MNPLRKVGIGPIDTHMSIQEAANKMRANFETMGAERRALIIAHFEDHCREIGFPLSAEFRMAFDLASKPWKDQS
jgi:hypothetical protein